MLSLNQYKTLEALFSTASKVNRTEWVNVNRIAKKLGKTDQQVINTLFKLQPTKYIELKKARQIKEYSARLTPSGIMNLATSKHNPANEIGSNKKNKFNIFTII